MDYQLSSWRERFFWRVIEADKRRLTQVLAFIQELETDERRAFEALKQPGIDQSQQEFWASQLAFWRACLATERQRRDRLMEELTMLADDLRFGDDALQA